jgi:ketosteroid isomerase-like protein
MSFQRARVTSDSMLSIQEDGHMEAHESADSQAVTAILRRINEAWLDGRPHDLLPLIHPEVTMVFPGFAGRIQGAESFIAGFEDFCRMARVHSYREDDCQVDVVADTAIASFRFEMVYEREGSSYQATGRDLWIFTRQAGGWLAAWRTMLDLHEQPA